MIKQKVQALIDQVCQLTLSGELNWTVTTSTKWSKMMKTTAEDGTKYEMDLKWVLEKEELVLEKPFLFIRSENLPGGLYCCNHTVYDTLKLRDILSQIHGVSTNLTTDDVCDAFDKMRVGMNKVAWREGQIGEILK